MRSPLVRSGAMPSSQSRGPNETMTAQCDTCWKTKPPIICIDAPAFCFGKFVCVDCEREFTTEGRATPQGRRPAPPPSSQDRMGDATPEKKHCEETRAPVLQLSKRAWQAEPEDEGEVAAARERQGEHAALEGEGAAARQRQGEHAAHTRRTHCTHARPAPQSSRSRLIFGTHHARTFTLPSPPPFPPLCQR